MRRVAFQLKVREDKIEEYKRLHEDVWPDMLEALRRHGWHNFSIFMLPDGVLFGYFETPSSFEDALAGMATEEVNDRWQADVEELFEGMDVHPDQKMVEIAEVFHLD